MNENFRKYIDSLDALFHYTRLSIAMEHILSKKKFKIPRLKDGNDPWEYKEKLINGIGGELPDRGLWQETHGRISRILDRCKRMSFCTQKKPEIILKPHGQEEYKYSLLNGWSKPRMWAQYSDNHRGICLVFSKKALKKELQEKSFLFEYYDDGYIQYTEKTRYSLPCLDINKIRKEGAESYSKKYIRENFSNLFLQKNIDFVDESEFRIVIIDPDNKLEYIDITNIIRGVIVGDKIPQVYLPSIIESCKNFDIAVGRIIYNRGNPLISNVLQELMVA